MKSKIIYFLISSVLLTSAAAPQADCNDHLRWSVSAFNRSIDYSKTLLPFLQALSEADNRQPEVLFKDGWQASIAAFNNNEADLIVVPHSLTSSIKNNPKNRVLAKIPGTNVILLVGKNSTITSIKDLKNKRVAVGKETNQRLLVNILTQADLNNDVELKVFNNPNEVFMSLFDNRTDAVFVAENIINWLSPSFRSKLKPIPEIVGKSKGFYLYVGPCVSDTALQSFQQVLFTPQGDERVSQFRNQFNIAEFIPASTIEND